MIYANDYQTLNEALDACAKHFGDTGGKLVLPAGRSVLSKPYAYRHHNLTIEGEGDGASRAEPHFDGGDILTFRHHSGGEIRNIHLRDFNLPPLRERTNGWALRFDKGVRCTVDTALGKPEDHGRHFGGVWFNDFDNCKVFGVDGYARNKCLLASGKQFGADLFIGQGFKMQNFRSPNQWVRGSALIHLAGGCGGINIETGDVIYGGIGVLVDTSVTGTANREIFFNGPWIDSCMEDGLRVMPNGCSHLELNGLWASSCGIAGGDGDGVSIEANQPGIMTGVISGGKFFNNRGSGVVINGGIWSVSGGCYDNNGQHGIYLPNSSVLGGVGGTALFFANRAGNIKNSSNIGFRVGEVVQV